MGLCESARGRSAESGSRHFALWGWSAKFRGYSVKVPGGHRTLQGRVRHGCWSSMSGVLEMSEQAGVVVQAGMGMRTGMVTVREYMRYA